MMDVELQSALDAIDVARLPNDDWLKLVGAMHDAGVTDGEIDAWNRRDERRYDERSNAKRQNSLHKPAPESVARKTIFKFAYADGWHWSKDGNDGLAPGQIIKGGPDASHPTGTHEAEQKDVPPTLDMTWVKPMPMDMASPDTSPSDMLRMQLSAMFRPCDSVNVVLEAKWRDGKNGKPGKWGPAIGKKGWRICPVGYWVDGNRPALVLERAHPVAGAWVRINPCTNGGDDGVTRYALALIEADPEQWESMTADDLEADKARQLDRIRLLHLPCAAIVDSGHKSVHAIVRVDAKDHAEYAARVEWLHEYCNANGFAVDSSNKNPSRLCRLAGAVRDGHLQRLIATDAGPRSWGEFRSVVDRLAEEHDTDGEALAYDDAADYICDPIEPPDALIPGILCRRHVMLIVAGYGTGKTHILCDCALAVATGGEWLGHRCESGRVLVINPEEAGEDYRDHMRLVARARDIDLLSIGPGKLRTLTTRGKFVTFETLAKRIADSGEQYDLICVDSINALLDGDENSSIDVRRFFILANQLAEATGASVLAIHHITSKAPPGKIRRGARARGSSVFGDAPDVYAEIVPLQVDEGSGAASLLSRYVQQARSGAPIWPTAHRLQFCKMRKYPRPNDMDLIWRWPVFVPDPTATEGEPGELGTLAILGSKKADGKKGGEQKAERDADNWAAQDEALAAIVHDLTEKHVEPTIKEAADPFNEARKEMGLKPVSLDTFRKYTAPGGKLSWRRRKEAPHALYTPATEQGGTPELELSEATKEASWRGVRIPDGTGLFRIPPNPVFAFPQVDGCADRTEAYICG